MRRSLNYDNAIPITRDIHWVGYPEQDSSLFCNPYLLLDGGGAVLFDPGSIPSFPVMMRKVIDLISPAEIELIVVAHQDPDVAGCLPILQDVIGNDEVPIAGHTNTLRLVRHLGYTCPDYAVDQHEWKVELKSGRVLEFIWTPYLHSPGAIATYDRSTKTLFSSDLFGGLSPEGWHLFASRGEFPESMNSFHQAYMPSNSIMRPVMEKFASLEIDRILPQHGSVIEGDLVSVAIEHLKGLPVGLDLLGSA